MGAANEQTPAPLPALFVSHGAPSLALEDGATQKFLRELGRSLPRPKGVVCISAHWEMRAPTVSAAPWPETIHDFYGFPAPLYEMRYPAPGDPKLATRTADLLRGSGHEVSVDPTRGLDHGAWVPLQLMLPEATVPVVQLSVQSALGARHHLELGRALAPLRDEGILILASGGATHNLRQIGAYAEDAEPVAYAADFDRWLHEAVATGDDDAIVDHLAKAPAARRNHPTPEHFLPLLVALGARRGDAGRRIHENFIYGILSLAAFGWG